MARGDEVVVVARAGATEIPGTCLVPARGPSFGRHAGRWLGAGRGQGSALRGIGFSPRRGSPRRPQVGSDKS